MANFRESYPLDFSLFDKDSQNVLYIEDKSDQQLSLHIQNAATKSIRLHNLTTTVTNTNFHFALRFRPGTLSPSSLGSSQDRMQLSPTAAINWEMAPIEQDSYGMDVIYIRSKTQDLNLEPNTLQTIVFDNVGANGEQGARGTRVELLYQNMAYSDTLDLEIKSNREIHLGVINHRGKQEIPLHIGFVGDNGVLNDGASPSQLKLRFANTLIYDPVNPDLSPLNFRYDADDTKRSKIILSFQSGDEADEAALGTDAELRNILVSQPPGWSLTEPIQGESPQWILRPTNNIVLSGRDAPQGNNNHFDLAIGNIITNQPTGHTHIYIRYENIPGYWDGQMELSMEKRPLVYKNKAVGIDKAEPSALLHVAQGTTITRTILHKITTAGGIAESVLELPGGIISATLDVRVRGDLVSDYEHINIFIDNQQVAGKLGEIGFADDTIFRVALAQENITSFLNGKSSVTLKSDATSYVDFQPIKDQMGSFAEAEWSIRIVHTTSAIFENRVGIGTTGPREQLEVNGSILAVEKIIPSTGNGPEDGIVFPSNPGGGVGDQASIRYYASTGEQTVLELKTQDNFNDHIALMPSGNVGVGTTNPVEQLEVNGSIKAVEKIVPSPGAGPNNGIVFPSNPFGGGGDLASIKYYPRVGESSVLEVKIANDGDDHIALMPSGNVGIGTTNPAAPLSIASGGGKESHPDSSLHMTNDCLMFGGNNSGKEANSAQISAGKHRANSLNIIGMSSGPSSYDRRVDMWAEGGFNLTGSFNITSNLNVNGSLNINNSKPFILRRYQIIQDNPRFNTNMNTNEYLAVVSGVFLNHDYGSANSQSIRGHFAMVNTVNGKWWIDCDVLGIRDVTWIVDVLFIKTNLASTSGTPYNFNRPGGI